MGVPTGGGATTIPNATHPLAICQNLCGGEGSWGGGGLACCLGGGGGGGWDGIDSPGFHCATDPMGPLGVARPSM